MKTNMQNHGFAFPRPHLLALLALVFTTACSSPTRPPVLTGEDLGGEYIICSLLFTPEHPAHPVVDIREQEMDLQARTPTLTVGRTRAEFEMEYREPGEVLVTRLNGTYVPARTGVTLTFNQQDANRARNLLLLPPQLWLDFQPSPRTLTLSEARHGGHTIPLARYGEMTGYPTQGLADPVRGTLSGQFRVGSCS